MTKPRNLGGGILAWGIFLLVVITGCEGSGSSGFDHTRPEREQTVLAEVDKQQKCGMFEGTTLCPSQVDIASGDPSSPYVIKVAPLLKDGLSCVLEGVSHSCRANLRITPKKAIKPEARFLMAVRYKHPFSSPWKIASSFQAIPSSAEFETVLPIKLSADNKATLDMVILVYQDPLQTLPGVDTTQEVLSDFKPSVAFVTLDVPVTGMAAEAISRLMGK